ncbi:MAG: hypothetical protein AAB613_02060 [Patescibacteria group bacterium]
MKEVDRQQKRWSMLATGVIGVLLLTFVIFFRLDGYDTWTKVAIYYSLFMLYSCLYLFYQSLMDSWVEEMEMLELRCNELFGINN